MKNLGKLHHEPAEIPAVLALKANDSDPDIVMLPARKFQRLTTEDGTPWNDACRAIKTKQDTWFIAVGEGGWIFMAEQDPTMITLADVDILVIKHPGGHDDIIAHRWTGKRVEDWS